MTNYSQQQFRARYLIGYTWFAFTLSGLIDVCLAMGGVEGAGLWGIIVMFTMIPVGIPMLLTQMLWKTRDEQRDAERRAIAAARS